MVRALRHRVCSIPNLGAIPPDNLGEYSPVLPGVLGRSPQLPWLFGTATVVCAAVEFPVKSLHTISTE